MWDDARVEALRKAWADGIEARLIAERIGQVSKNAVIGKAHRLGLAARKSGARPRVDQKSPKTQANREKMAQRIASLDCDWRRPPPPVMGPPVEPTPVDEALSPEIDVPMMQRKTFAALEDGECRWCVGDPRQPDHYFCGGKRVSGLPYCRDHASRAYRPAEAKQRPVPAPMPRTRMIARLHGIATDRVREFLS